MRKSLDTYDEIPEGMRAYLAHYGFHFCKKAVEYAIKGMKRKNPATGKMEHIEPTAKEEVEQLLLRNNVKLDNNVLYDFVFVYHMAKADYWGSSIEDEKHLALYIKDVIDDADSSDESAFRCWYAKRIGNGDPVDWDEMM